MKKSLDYLLEITQSPVSVLNWLTRFPYHAFLQSFNYEEDPYGQFEWVAAWGSDNCPKITSFAELVSCPKEPEHYWFGGFSYSLVERLEPVVRLRQKPSISLPEVFLFAAEGVICKRKKQPQPEVLLFSESNSAELSTIFSAINSTCSNSVSVKNVLEYSHYQQVINKILSDIYAGNTYELNFTSEFTVSGRLPLKEFYHQLTAISQVPFAFWFAWKHIVLAGSSPERFLAKRAELLVAQPIKGTVVRGNSAEEELFNRLLLQTSTRFQAENVMIVDLMRNDFYKVCLPHTVNVPDLFRIQTLNNLFHLYSTITGTCRPDVTLPEILQAVFPTGSMTGAPKIRTIQLIDNYEVTGRGIYSGALGYWLPSGDFDFAVVIRTLVYDVLREIGSFHVGGAIIAESKPAEEWDELMLKSQNIWRVLQRLAR